LCALAPTLPPLFLFLSSSLPLFLHLYIYIYIYIYIYTYTTPPSLSSYCILLSSTKLIYSSQNALVSPPAWLGKTTWK
jgi:hypothetical protein